MNNTFDMTMQVIGGLSSLAIGIFALVCIINGLGNTVGLVSLWLRRREKAINLHRAKAAGEQHVRWQAEHAAGALLAEEKKVDPRVQRLEEA